MPVCITGMHRSGTSMVTRILRLAGMYLGDEAALMPATGDNPDGFWEHLGFVDINDELLNELGGGWDLPASMPDAWGDDARMRPIRDKAESLVAGFVDREPWGWKDPRNSLTLPFWNAVAGPLKVVLCVRNPLEIVLSLRRRNYFSYSLSLSLWRAYNESVLAATEPASRLVTHYDAYFEDPRSELRRLLEFAELKVSEGATDACAAAIASRLRHHRFTAAHLAEAELAPEIVDLYRRLCLEAGRRDGAVHARPRRGEQPAVSATKAVSGGKNAVRLANAVVIDLRRQLGDLQATVAATTATLAEKDAALAVGRHTIAAREAVIADKDAERAAAIAERDAAIAEREAAIAEREAVIAEREAAIAERDVALAARQAEIDELRAAGSAQRDIVHAAQDELKRRDEIIERLRTESGELARELSEARRRCERLDAAAQREYEHLKHRLFELIEASVPRGATVWMVSRGDEALVRLNGRPASHFPQDPRGRWPGHYPADSAAAIAQLEALRARGGAFLVFPATARWWLDHYAEFRTYLQTRCRTVADREDTAIIFEVPDLAWRRRMGAVVAAFQKRFDRDPAILDWNSGLELAAAFPHATVFAPPEAAPTLPYLDRSIDIVVCPGSARAVAEARRVASAVVVTTGRSANSGKSRTRQPGSFISLRHQWIANGHPARRRTGTRTGGRR